MVYKLARWSSSNHLNFPLEYVLTVTSWHKLAGAIERMRQVGSPESGSCRWLAGRQADAFRYTNCK